MQVVNTGHTIQVQWPGVTWPCVKTTIGSPGTFALHLYYEGMGGTPNGKWASWCQAGASLCLSDRLCFTRVPQSNARRCQAGPGLRPLSVCLVTPGARGPDSDLRSQITPDRLGCCGASCLGSYCTYPLVLWPHHAAPHRWHQSCVPPPAPSCLSLRHDGGCGGPPCGAGGCLLPAARCGIGPWQCHHQCAASDVPCCAATDFADPSTENVVSTLAVTNEGTAVKRVPATPIQFHFHTRSEHTVDGAWPGVVPALRTYSRAPATRCPLACHLLLVCCCCETVWLTPTAGCSTSDK